MASKNTLTIEVEPRERAGSSSSRALRRQGRIPAVIYGHGKPALSIVVAAEEVGGMLRHAGMLTFQVAGAKDKRNGILKDIQRHPITGNVLHMDFQEVKADEIITVVLPIEPHGEPLGLSHGAMLEQMLHELEVRCRPDELVEALQIDVSQLEVDDILHVEDLPLPEGMVATADADQAVFQVRVPRVSADAEEAIAAEGEGEDEGEEAEGTAEASAQAEEQNE